MSQNARNPTVKKNLRSFPIPLPRCYAKPEKYPPKIPPKVQYSTGAATHHPLLQGSFFLSFFLFLSLFQCSVQGWMAPSNGVSHSPVKRTKTFSLSSSSFTYPTLFHPIRMACVCTVHPPSFRYVLYSTVHYNRRPPIVQEYILVPCSVSLCVWKFKRCCRSEREERKKGN